MAADSYRRTQVQAATPMELVVMLYDGALQFMGDAREAIRRKDILARRDAINRTLAIIAQLQATLDKERGGEIAEQLARLYAYVTSRLFDAAINNAEAPVAEAQKVVETLRDAWRSIATSPAAARS